MISKSKALKLCVASAVLGGLLVSIAAGFALYRLSPLGKVYSIANLLDKEFYKPVDRDKLFEGAARGVVAALEDPYSVYMDPMEWQNFIVRTSGEYSGIGITIGVKDGRVEIAQPMKGTPAEAAGLKAKDVILKVDGKTISTSDEAALLIRGPAGTDVTLTILRGDETFDVTITRQEISVPAVTYSMLEDKIGYIELFSFNRHAAFETAQALRDLKEQGAGAIVLDLRYNGGGYLDEAIGVAELFVPKGTVVSLRYKSEPAQEYKTTGSGLGMPLVVLVNQGTASASEILAGAIQDHKVGVLVGTTTFGKGLVQQTYPLQDGSVIKLTKAEYLTPNGRAINGAGLVPDYQVEGDEAQMEKAKELARAAIKGQ